MPDSRDGNPVATLLILVIVSLIAAFVFLHLNRQTRRPEASGLGGVGVDAATNAANRH
jgi:hypothetical protein